MSYVKLYIVLFIFPFAFGIANSQFINGDFTEWEEVDGFNKPKGWGTNQTEYADWIFKAQNNDNSWLKFDVSYYVQYACAGYIQQLILQEEVPPNAALNFSLRTQSLNADSSTYFSVFIRYFEEDFELIETLQFDYDTLVPEFIDFSIPIPFIEAKYISFQFQGGARSNPLDGCYDWSIIEIDDVLLSVNTSQVKPEFEGISIYPNPVSDIMRIKNDINENPTYRIIDINGNFMTSEFYDNERSIYDFNPGKYFLITDEEVITPFVKI